MSADGAAGLEALARAARTLSAPLGSLPDPLPIPALPAGATFDITRAPPGSKSLTNRALLLAALATGRSELRGALLDADDGRAMVDALRALGARIDVSADAARVEGLAGRLRAGAGGARVDARGAGTAARFLAAAALLADGPVTIDGDARMRERPIGELASALSACGARVAWLGREGFPPVRIAPGEGPTPGAVTLPTTASGQFVSALLLAAPWLRGGLTVRIDGEPTSPPYIAMTLRLLRALGVGASWSADLRELRVEPLGPGGLAGFTLDVEPDASGATCLWAAAAATPGAAWRTPGIGSGSLQGDAGFVDVLAAMGARVERDERGTAVRGGPGLRGVDVDLSGMPDAAMALAAIAPIAHGETVIRGLRTLRVKESDRLSALETELRRAGADARAEGDALRIRGGARRGEGAPTALETYRDHRMAMAAGVMGLWRGGVSVRDPGCVAKTYPGFWSDLGSALASAGRGGCRGGSAGGY